MLAAAAAEPNGASIEALFRPSTRFRDSHRNRRNFSPNGWTEIELLPHLTPLDILATGVTWDEFRLFLLDKLVWWMTPDVYIFNMTTSGTSASLLLRLGGENGTKLCVHVTRGTAAAVATATCDFAVRLLATCEQRDISIRGGDYDGPAPLSGPCLSLFFQESRDDLQKVTLYRTVLSADLCLALATMSRLDVEVSIRNCSLSNNAAGAFIECLQSDRGPANLDMCKIDSQILANALTGDSRVTRFKPHADWTDDAEKAFLFRSLANNRGLVDLLYQHHSISDENWTILCQSLQAHPTLTSLDLRDTAPTSPDADDDDDDDSSLMPDEQKAHRSRLLTEMMQQNKVLHTIHLSEEERDEKIYTEEIHPYLETNLYRPRVLAVKKTIERPFREKILGRALDCVKSNPNLVWMLLSENVDAFVRSEEEEEEEESNSEEPVAVAAAAAAVVLTVAGSKRKR
jgi:hypothetical protein